MAKTKSALTLQAETLNKLSSVLIALVSQDKVTQADRDQAKSDLAALVKEDADNADAVDSATQNLNKLVELVSDAIVPAAPATSEASPAPAQSPVVAQAPVAASEQAPAVSQESQPTVDTAPSQTPAV